jgi:hypothetical protein
MADMLVLLQSMLAIVMLVMVMLGWCGGGGGGAAAATAIITAAAVVATVAAAGVTAGVLATVTAAFAEACHSRTHQPRVRRVAAQARRRGTRASGLWEVVHEVSHLCCLCHTAETGEHVGLEEWVGGRVGVWVVAVWRVRTRIGRRIGWRKGGRING